MKPYRPARVAELLKQELSQIIHYELDDPRIKPATVTHVKVSPDLRHARVYVTITGSREEIDETVQGLNRAAGFIRRQLYPRLHLRFIPELRFSYDDTLEAAARIDELLAETTKHPED